MLKEIASFIATKSGLSLGTTLQFGYREDDAPIRCVTVAFNGGGSVLADIPSRTDQMVQILARANEYLEGYDDSMLIYLAIHGTAGWMLPVLTSGETYEVYFIEALNPPQYLGTDAKGYHEWTTNFIFRIRKK